MDVNPATGAYYSGQKTKGVITFKDWIRKYLGSLRVFFTLVAIALFLTLVSMAMLVLLFTDKTFPKEIWTAYIALQASLVTYVVSEGIRKSD